MVLSMDNHETSPAATPHPTYYMHGGMVELKVSLNLFLMLSIRLKLVFEVERTLFCIPRHYLTHESSYFRDLLEEYDYANHRENTLRSPPLCLNDVSSTEFERLLSVIDPL